MLRSTLFLLFTISLLSIQCNGASIVKKPKAADCKNLSQEFIDDIAAYRPIVKQIIDYYLKGDFKGKTYKQLSDFVDKFGPRVSGSKALEDSIDYMIEASKQHKLDNVHREPVEVPKWVRGEETLTLLKPKPANLQVIGLGLSIPTPADGITANAIVVKSFDELKALEDSKVAGKIVVFDEEWVSYGQTVQYRRLGAVEASKKGAVAALVKSVTPFSIGTVHTGIQDYDDKVKKIPVAAITHEDADMMWRMQNKNETIELTLKMASTFDVSVSYNVVSELKGTEDKYVIVSGHIDSWDVGDGAMDDGGGIMISWLAPVAMKNLNLKPRRTVRSVLFTAEEEGLIGAISYEERNREESKKYSFVMESDSGTFKPLGISYEGGEDGECMVREILKLFDSIGTNNIKFDGSGPDIGVWTSQGIPGGGFLNENDKYFWFHHTNGDRINVLNSDTLDLGGAFWTAFSYVVADMKYEIPRTESKPFVIDE